MAREPRQDDYLSHNGQGHTSDTTLFDCGAAAELFAGLPNKGRNVITYKRFESAAEARRFAIEEAPAQAMVRGVSPS